MGERVVRPIGARGVSRVGRRPGAPKTRGPATGCIGRVRCYNTHPFSRSVMADAIRVGIIGGGWPGKEHARGDLASGVFGWTAVADLIPSRRRDLMNEFKVPREYATWEELVADRELD